MNEKENEELVIYNPINELLNTKRLTKKCITNLADNFIKEIFLFSSGVKELITVNALKMLIERMDKQMRELLIDVEKDTYKGVTVETVNGPTVLDFEQDPEYQRLNEAIKLRKGILMQQYKLSRNPANIGKEFIGIVDAGGAQIPVVEAKSDNKSTIKLTFPN